MDQIGQFNQMAAQVPTSAWQSVGNVPVRRPGNFLTHLLPIAGATLATLAAPETGGLSLAALLAAGGLGAAGAAGGKIVENKVEDIANPDLKQSMLSGVGGQALQGGIAGGAGELLSPITNKLVGGAGDLISKLLGRGGAEAATQGAEQGATDIASQGASDIATAANVGKGDVLRAGVRNLDPIVRETPGLASNAADNVARINQFADQTASKEYGVDLTGSAAKQGRAIPTLKAAINDKLDQAFAGDTTQPFTAQEVKQSLEKAVTSHPLYPSSLTGVTPEGTALDNSLRTATSLVDNMAEKNDGRFSLKDLNTLRQQIDKGINFNASPDAAASINNEAGNAMRQTLNESIKSNPEIAKLIEHQQNAIVLDKGLAASAGKATGQQGGVMAGATGVRARLPGAASLMQGGQDALGRSLQEISSNPVGSVAGRLVPQAGAAAVSNANQQEQTQQGAATVGNVDLTQPSKDIADQLTQFTTPSTGMNLPSPEKIQAAMQQDLQTTGGKNYAILSKMLTLSDAQQKETTLPTSATKSVQVYQQDLGTLQSIAEAFQGGGDFNALHQQIVQATPALMKAAGQTGNTKAFAALMPAPGDRPDIAIQKLQAIKQMIDANASDNISQSLTSGTTNTDQASLLAAMGIGQ